MSKLLVIAEGEFSNEVLGLLQELSDVPTVMFTTLMFGEFSPMVTRHGFLRCWIFRNCRCQSSGISP